MLEKENVVKLFVEYGFDYQEKISGKNFLVFTFKTGFFHNVEIVLLSKNLDEVDKKEIDKVIEEYKRLRFSVGEPSEYNDINEIRNKLFDGFFETKEWKKNILETYSIFCSDVLKSLPDGACEYSYINSSFVKNDGSVSETSIVEDVIKELNVPGPSLILMEAPAGYGKTCTSYEVIRNMAQSKLESMPIPFFTEFSRDRQAVTFSHIFVKEVDRSFRVKSDLVIQEVQNGRIVVVLDGFDELLHDSKEKKDSVQKRSFENVEPMLETIGDLLIKNAKIIITSRRSAVFDSAFFYEWMNRREKKFNIIRYRINPPKLSDWLPENRINAIKNTSLILDNLSNPVLLSFLRFVSEEKFNELMDKPFEIIDAYIENMLDRERGRQELRMSSEEQNMVLTAIAQDMSLNNYTSVSKEDLVNTIKSLCGPLLEKTRNTYPIGTKPTIDKLATTLSHHCFFDRCSNGNSIQFINEFVFGYYLSSCLMQSEDWLPYDERFLEPAVLSFQAREKEKKESMWNKIETIKGVLEKSDRIKFEKILRDKVDDAAYDNSDIKDVFFDNICFFETQKINNAAFFNCKFRDCMFYLDNFSDVSFLNCIFWNCSSVFNEKKIMVDFHNCDAPESDFISKIESIKQNEEVGENQDVEKYILGEICPLGSSLSNAHFYWPMLINTKNFSKKQIFNGLKSLKSKGFLDDAHNHDFMRINTSKYGEIKRLLGRA